MMRLFTGLLLACCFSFTAAAQDAGTTQDSSAGPQTPAQQTPAQQGPAHPAATTYSNGYETRLKIHKYASYATLPLFGVEFALGQSLYDNPERGLRRDLHGVVGTGIVGLFAVNSVTGVWNLWEGRHDTDGRTIRMIHSVLMLASDGGFVAALATAPHTRNGIILNPQDKSTHRDIAVASIGVGTAGYLLMLFKGK